MTLPIASDRTANLVRECAQLTGRSPSDVMENALELFLKEVRLDQIRYCQRSNALLREVDAILKESSTQFSDTE